MAEALEVRVLGSVSEVDQAAWDALVRPSDSPFLKWSWLHGLECTGCARRDRGWLPCHLTLYENGHLVGAAPAYLKGNSEGEFVFDWRFAEVAARMGVDYYPKLIIAVPFTPATGTRFLVAPSFDRARAITLLAAAAIEVAKQSDASGVHVLFAREDEISTLSEVGFAERHGIQYHWHQKGADSFEGFLARLPTKKRTQVRRERKEMALRGIEIKTLVGDDYTQEAAHTMYRFYLSTVDKFMWGRRYLNEKFFEHLATHFREHLAWVFAYEHGRPIAGAFNVRGDGVLYGRYWGADADVPFLHFNVCYYHGIDDCLRWGLHTFEPGAGGEHKHARGFDETVTRSAHAILHPKLRAMMETFFDSERAAIAKHLARP